MRRTVSQNALNFHSKLTVVDGHCDTILKVAGGHAKLAQCNESNHVDLIKMQEGGTRVQFFALFIESVYKPGNALSRTLQLIDTFYSEMDSCSHAFATGLKMTQIIKELKRGKIIAVMGIEGGEVLHGDIAVLRILYRLGVRFLGLTWNQRNDIADGAAENVTGGGLTCFGRNVVQEMNRLGMIIDLAHISDAGFWDVMKVSRLPVMVSHANCRRLCDHPRNLTDEQIRALSESNGILGLSFVPQFLGKGKTDVNDLISHIDHVAGLAGTDVIGLGSDFDGIENTAAGLDDCRCYPAITERLLKRGYTEKEIRGIMGENMLKFMKRTLQ